MRKQSMVYYNCLPLYCCCNIILGTNSSSTIIFLNRNIVVEACMIKDLDKGTIKKKKFQRATSEKKCTRQTEGSKNLQHQRGQYTS